MVFLSICTALYDYVPQGEGELAITEGEIIYILEKSTEDDWWKAKKKAAGEDGEEEVGLIPNNYVEEAEPSHHAKALYDYGRQTEEELSFTEDSPLLVYDTSDPDWTLVGLNGEFGFAPSNYIEIVSEAEQKTAAGAIIPPLSDSGTTQDTPAIPTSTNSAERTPATALARVLQNRGNATAPRTNIPAEQAISSHTSRPQYTPEASDDEVPTPPAPSLPRRPPSQQLSPQSPPSAPYVAPASPEPPGVIASPPYNRAVHSAEKQPIPGGYRLYSVNEMVSVLGKQKKMPTTLGVNLATGMIIIIPAKKRDGPQQEWTAEKLKHYSIEGKHVFMELVQPSKSIDFHAGAKDTAVEIVSVLGELAGASKAEGLREVLAASEGSHAKGQRKGSMRFDFMAQGDDEVTVAKGDEVIILDDETSDDWWKVRRVKNGKEGVVPRSFVEAGEVVLAPTPSNMSGLNAGRSVVEQNRLEEERMAKELIKEQREREANNDFVAAQVGPGLRLPNRGSSLTGGHEGSSIPSRRSKRDSRSEGKSSSTKTKPDASKVRTWTDRSGSFKVDAQFVGVSDGKITLHKLNGVKIAVPVVKMATEDLEYVESVTGMSLDEDKPLSDIRRKNQKGSNGNDRSKQQSTKSGIAGATVEQPKRPEYDWFDFFLKCGVSPYHCERYSHSFNRDSMDEGVLADVTPEILRTLGLKEGDVIRVMKFLDGKYGRTGAKSKLRNVSFGGEHVLGEGDDEGTSGGLFSGPGGTLKNNTRKSRPAPAVQTSDVVDPKAFRQKDSDDEAKPPPVSKSPPPQDKPGPKPPSKGPGGFEDDAWDVKPTKKKATDPTATDANTAAPVPAPTPAPSASPPSTLTGALADLSLLSQPLQPTILHNTGGQSQSAPQVNQPLPQPTGQQQQSFQPRAYQQAPQNPPQQFQQQTLQPQATGATPAFFGQIGQQPNISQQQNIPQIPQLPFNQQQTGVGLQVPAPPRQRPQAPQFIQTSSLVPPPPTRPLSAPQNVQTQSNFGPPPLQPQLTGVPNQGGYHNQVTSPTQILNDINRLRLQQQLNQQQQGQIISQFTGINQSNQAFNQFGSGIQSPQQQQLQYQLPQLQTHITGIQPSPLYLNGQQAGSPFADPRSPPQSVISQNLSTGFSPNFYNGLQPQPTGSINSVLPPALQPQSTGLNGYGVPGFGQFPPPVPPIPQQPVLAPLQPQKTGPAPPVRFGVDAKKLMPQPTGRKANLSQATPQNPFGF